MSKELSNLIIEFYERLNLWELEVVAASGLTPAQMHAVEMIGHLDSPTMKQLAIHLGVAMGTLTVMIDRLEDQNLAERQPNPHDRRSYVIALTREGHKLYSEHDRHHLTLTSTLFDQFSERDIATFTKLLRKVTDRFPVLEAKAQ
jgi:DNA-binding MarR family transcriptional regulator